MKILWASEWAHKDISLWAIWNAICASNAPDSLEIGELLGNKKMARHSCLTSTSESDWVAQEWNIATKLGTLIDMPGERIRRAGVLDLCLFREMPYMICDSVRYCSECLKYGYHSTVFQNFAIQLCPIHGAKLIRACTYCGKNLAKTFATVSTNPFSCPSCGGSLGYLPEKEIARQFSTHVHFIAEARDKLTHQLDKSLIRRSSFAVLFHDLDKNRDADVQREKLFFDLFSAIQSESKPKAFSRSLRVVDDVATDWELEGIWADQILTFGSVRACLAKVLQPVSPEVEVLKELLGFRSTELRLNGHLNPLAVAFYKWHALYIRGDVQRFEILAERIQERNMQIFKQMIPQLSDIAYESRQANQAIFEIELFATFLFFLFEAARTHTLAETNWHALPTGHALLPYWQLKSHRNSIVLTVYQRVSTASVLAIVEKIVSGVNNCDQEAGSYPWTSHLYAGEVDQNNTNWKRDWTH